MTRTGKIARLPRKIRDELNHRLDDGQPGTELVAWLNALPDVQDVLAAEFGGRPVNEQNLSDWKQGGFRDWQGSREALALARELCEQADELKQLAGDGLGDRLSPLLALRLLSAVKALDVLADGTEKTDAQSLHQLCGDLVALRKADQSAARIELDRERNRWR